MELQIGDRIRITSVPSNCQPETIRVYNKIIKRKRPVKISQIDEWGNPWYEVRFKIRGRLEYHFLAVFEFDTNWVKVVSRQPL